MEGGVYQRLEGFAYNRPGSACDGECLLRVVQRPHPLWHQLGSKDLITTLWLMVHQDILQSKPRTIVRIKYPYGTFSSTVEGRAQIDRQTKTQVPLFGTRSKELKENNPIRVLQVASTCYAPTNTIRSSRRKILQSMGVSMDYK